MNKTLSYSGLAISGILIILAFITAKTYTQLAIAAMLYPLLAYFALKVIPGRDGGSPTLTIQVPARPVERVAPTTVIKERVEVADVDKRTFLKLIGAAGLSFFVFSLLGRRVESLIFDRAVGSGSNNFGGGFSGDITSGTNQPFEGYKITEIDDNIISYYGFTNQKGAWLIMREDTATSSFRYAKGNSNFSENWGNREDLTYDYYFNLF